MTDTNNQDGISFFSQRWNDQLPRAMESFPGPDETPSHQLPAAEDAQLLTGVDVAFTVFFR